MARVLDVTNESAIQFGDPAKAGLAIVKLIKATDRQHLLLGPDALDYVTKDLDTVKADFAPWESVTRSTNFD